MTQTKKLIILETAIELFSKHGFEAISIQDITEHCGISKGAFYLSFKSKDELMLALIEHILTQVALIFDRAVNNKLNPHLALFKLFEELLGFMHSYRGLAMYFFNEQMHFQNKNTNFICIIQKYERESNAILCELLDRVYGDTIENHKQDLILSLNSLFHTYFEYVCIRGLDMEVSLLAQSLIEKINILANAKYDYALPNEKLLDLASQYQFSKEELDIFKSRLLNDIKLHLLEDQDSFKHQAFQQLQQQLINEQPDVVLLYAFCSLISEYGEYKHLALRLRAYLKIVYPQ